MFFGTLLTAFRQFARRFGWATVYFLAAFAIGTAGFAWIEEWSFLDALYMSVTTITSVGFMEVQPLSAEGRVFAMVLIGLGITGLGIWWGLVTALIVELDLKEFFRERRTMRDIEKLRDHFIVCGTGNMGRVVAEEMGRSNIPYLVIERDPARIRQLREANPAALAIEGDATKEHTLQEARIESARGLAVCLTDDADNLFASLTARGLNPDLTIVARAQDEEALSKLKRAGADHTISPNMTGGIRMASMLIRPSVVSFLDVATASAEISLRLEETSVPDQSNLAGHTLSEARIPQETGLVVLALRRQEGPEEFLFNPGPETRLEAGDVILTLGRQEQIAGLRDYLGGRRN